MRYSLLSFAVCLSACQNLPSLEPGSSEVFTNDTSGFSFQGRKSHAWVSDDFTGTHSRQMTDDVTTFTVAQSDPRGGLDVGFSKSGIKSSSVAGVRESAKICSSYKISLS